MMTDADIDLIRAAGKAVGLTLQLALGFTDGDRGLHTADGKEWNPLTSDADAFRLAVALGINIAVYRTGSPPNLRTLAVRAFAGHAEASEQAHADPAAATRRAIVRAAAATGAKGE